jgi:tetratricopeptide (TPR) repeat protein
MLYEGRARSAVAELTEAVSLTEAAKAWLSEYRNRVILAEASLTLGEAALARRQLDSAAALGKTLRLDPVFLLYFGHAALRAGQRDRAKQALEQLIAGGPIVNDFDRNARAGLEGSIRVAQGDAGGALAVTRQENGQRVVSFRLAARAEAYLKRQHPDSALAVATQLSNTFSFGEEAQLEWQRGPLLVARASESLGDSATARAAYRRFIEQWKQGDQDLPELVLAGRALARLQASVPR